jgi:hypothetical protein
MYFVFERGLLIRKIFCVPFQTVLQSQYNSNQMKWSKRHDFQFELKIKGVSIKANILKMSEDGKTV